jgi:hypothetical protein
VTTPFPFVALNILNASDLNALGTWDESSWTSPLSNITVGNGTETARYMRIGDGTEVGLVAFFYKLVFGSTTTVDGTPSLTYPVAGQDSRQVAAGCVAFFEDASGSDNWGGIYRNSGTEGTLSAMRTDQAYANRRNVSASVPFTWTTSDVIVIVGYYQPT